MTSSSLARLRRALRLRCAVQSYEWGRIGEHSEVGRLFALQSDTALEDGKPYAELWMGTHQSGPSYVMPNEDDDEEAKEMSLKEWLSANPEALGAKVLQQWGADLPFLFKVLSIAKALSIQAHPDKTLASKLHQLQPNIYKDSNHKPEMALALTDFEALCGFVSPLEIGQVVISVPELFCVLGESVSKALVDISRSKGNEEAAKATLQMAFTKIMTADEVEVTDALAKLVPRLTNEQQVRVLTSKEKLVLRLAKQYPDDVGVLSAFFFNYIQLVKGEALYLDANEPHAYISGECVECMATSDNVVRAGLTPKYRDTETLCSMLTYKQEAPEILRGARVNAYTKRYSPPFDEFEVDCSVVPPGHSLDLSADLGPSLIIVLEGKGVVRQGGDASKLRRGDIFFIPAGAELEMRAMDGPNESSALHVYRAGVSTRMLMLD